MERRWFLKKTNPDFIKYLSQTTPISPVLAQVLANRGINSPDKIRAFLASDLGSLVDPFSLPDVDKAVDRIRRAVKAGERVLIHGDYDADGVTSTTILLLTLRRLGILCDFFIPNRFGHGYGFNHEAIGLASGAGISLIITVDCGINSCEEVLESKRRGIDVIITDHHEPYRNEDGTFRLPEAEAVVNPKLLDFDLPLCGAGVALKLSEALLGKEAALEFFDLAALGTVADMVPLQGDNRTIVKRGIEMLNSGSRLSISVLREAASLSDKTITPGVLCYSMIPRINASGGVAEAAEVVRFFISEDRDEAFRIARRLNENNSERYRIEEGVYTEALSRARERSYENCIVLSGRSWHEGVIGIVASKIAEAFQRPTFVFSIKDGVAKGSARSVPGFDICAGLNRCSDLLIRHGGHKQAAGLSLREELLSVFGERMDAVIAEEMRGSGPDSHLLIDAEVDLKEITFPFLKELSTFEPFGFGNEQPLFAARKLQIMSPRIVGKNHVKLKLRNNSCSLEAIGFDLGNDYERMKLSGLVDAVFFPTINEWNGGKFLQLNIRAFRPSQEASN